MQITSSSLIATQINPYAKSAPEPPADVQAKPDSSLSAPGVKIGSPVNRASSVTSHVRVEVTPHFYGISGVGACRHIMDAIGGGPGRFKLILQDAQNHESFSGYKAYQSYANGFLNAGEHYDRIYQKIAAQLAGTNGSGEKDINAFTAFAAGLKPEQLQTFLRSYLDAPVPLTGEQGRLLMEFAATLEGDDLRNFMVAIHNSPGDLRSIINTASQLTGDDRANFLRAAAAAGEKVTSLVSRVDKMLTETSANRQDALSSFLAAAAKAGPRVTDLLTATANTGRRTTDSIVSFINNEITSREEMENFGAILERADSREIEKIIGLAEGLADDERGKLLALAAGTDQRTLTQLTETLSSLARPGGQLGDFITTAVKAENRLDSLLKLRSQIDLAFTATLTAVDTVNFLDAAGQPGANPQELTRLGSRLTESQRSHLFYAAARPGNDQGALLRQAQRLPSAQLDDFLIAAANAGQAENHRAIYMKGLLSEGEYRDFQQSAARLGERHFATLLSRANDYQDDTRADFLAVAATSRNREDFRQLTARLDSLAPMKQADLLELARDLGHRELNQLFATVEKAGPEAGRLIALAGSLKHSSRDAFSNLLTVGERVTPGELTQVMDVLSDIQENYFNYNVCSPDCDVSWQEMQYQFLKLAAKVGDDLRLLLDIARPIISDNDMWSRNLLSGMMSSEAMADMAQGRVTMQDFHSYHSKHYAQVKGSVVPGSALSIYL